MADLEKSERFYTETLGLSRVTYIEFGEGPGALEKVILAVPEQAAGMAQLNLIRYPNLPVPTPGEAVFGFMVDNIEATMSAVVAAGSQIAVPLQEIPDHRLKLSFITDPEGHMIEILHSF